MSIVNENFVKVTAGKSLPSTQNKIAVHHYMIKSLEVGCSIVDLCMWDGSLLPCM